MGEPRIGLEEKAAIAEKRSALSRVRGREGEGTQHSQNGETGGEVTRVKPDDVAHVLAAPLAEFICTQRSSRPPPRRLLAQHHHMMMLPIDRGVLS
jgi:hypothetical protein